MTALLEYIDLILSDTGQAKPIYNTKGVPEILGNPPRYAPGKL